MDWSQALLEVIDPKAFASLWYWVIVAVMWSSVSHWVLGVPYDMIQRARRHGGEAEEDLVDLVRINVTRLLAIAQTAGLILIGLVCFILTSLGILAFWYWLELAQAFFLLAFPLSIVGAVSLSTAKLIRAQEPLGEALFSVLNRHRLWTQIIGMISIFVTAMFGMYQNLFILRGL